MQLVITIKNWDFFQIMDGNPEFGKADELLVVTSGGKVLKRR
jgi:hypothetical protein